MNVKIMGRYIRELLFFMKEKMLRFLEEEEEIEEFFPFYEYFF